MTHHRFLLGFTPLLLLTACSDDGASDGLTPVVTTDPEDGGDEDNNAEDASQTSDAGDETEDTADTEDTTEPDEPTTSDVEPTTGPELDASTAEPSATSEPMTTNGSTSEVFTSDTGEPKSCLEIYNCMATCADDACLDQCAHGEDYDAVVAAYYLYLCATSSQCETEQCLVDTCPSEVEACVPSEPVEETDSGVPAVEACPSATGSGTTHAGFIEANETWTAAGSPHIVTSSINIRGATVTVEPCATVYVNEGAFIAVGQTSGSPAALLAQGEYVGDVLRPVIFTAAIEETFWGGVSTLPTGTTELTYTIVARAGHESGPGIGQPSAVLAYGDDNRTTVIPNVNLQHVLIQDSAGLGLAAMASGGFSADSVDVTVASAGLAGTQSGNIKTTYAAYVQAPAIHTLPEGDYTDNAVPVVLADAPFAVEVDEAFHDRGVPYQFVSELRMRPATNEPTTLTIDPGVTLRFGGEDYPAVTGMVLGDIDRPLRLNAAGTAEKAITFTSGAATPAAGDWFGIWWSSAPTSGNVMDYAVVEYGGAQSGGNGQGCGPGDNDALLIVAWEPNSAFITNSTFRNSAVGGIVSAWSSDDPVDLTGNNTFSNIENSCNVSQPRNAEGNCASAEPMCF